MIVERMVNRAPRDERGHYDGGDAYSVLSEVEPQSVPSFLSLGNPVAGWNRAARFHVIVKATVFVIHTYQQTRLPDRRIPDCLIPRLNQTSPAGGIVFRML